MTELRRQLALPPAQQIEELTNDVDRLQAQVDDLVNIINGMGNAVVTHEKVLYDLTKLVMMMRGESSDTGRDESGVVSDVVEESTVEGDREPGVGGTVSD